MVQCGCSELLLESRVDTGCQSELLAVHPGIASWLSNERGEDTGPRSCSIFRGPLFELCVELALALTKFARMNTACAQTRSSPEVVQMGRYIHPESQVQHPIRVLPHRKRTCFTEGHQKHAYLSSLTPTHTETPSPGSVRKHWRGRKHVCVFCLTSLQ